MVVRYSIGDSAEGQFGYYNCNLIFEVCEEITASKIDFRTIISIKTTIKDKPSSRKSAILVFLT